MSNNNHTCVKGSTSTNPISNDKGVSPSSTDWSYDYNTQAGSYYDRDAMFDKIHTKA